MANKELAKECAFSQRTMIEHLESNKLAKDYELKSDKKRKKLTLRNITF